MSLTPTLLGASIAAPGRSPAWQRRIAAIGLPHLLTLALIPRMVALAVPSIAHPDEVFQYLETAHRLVFGYGVVTWEWRYGMRGWLLPVLVSLPMRLGDWLSPASGLYLFLPKLAMTLGSLSVVAVAWRLGAGLSRRHALIAGLVAATWYEFVLFAPHILAESVSTALFLPAALLLVDRARWTPGRIAIAGLLLGLAAAMRFQHLPAICTLLAICCGPRLRETWRPLLAGGAAALAVSGACDAAMGQIPFAWFAENVRLNLIHDRAAEFGTSGPLGYLADFWPRWSLWGIPILILAAQGARRYPALAWVAAVNLAFHCAIAHKEYRFILLSTTLTLLLAAIGTVDRAERIARRHGAEAGGSRLRFSVACWLIASANLAAGPARSLWNATGPKLDLYAGLRHDPALCGIAVYRHNLFGTASYASLHRDVPIEVFTDREPGPRRADLAAHAGEVNTVLTTPNFAGELPPSFTPMACEGSGEERACLYRRPGPCAGALRSRFAVQRVLLRFDR